MTKAQEMFDKYVQPMSEELKSPKLHKVLNDSYVKTISLGGKGVGSQGDGSVQFIVENERKQIITKMPENIKNFSDTITNNGNVSINDLIEAFQKFLDREKEKQPLHTKVTNKELSVEKRINNIKNILSIRKKVNFIELFDAINKEYVIVTFLAILEMAKDNEIKLYQDKNFGNIICEVS